MEHSKGRCAASKGAHAVHVTLKTISRAEDTRYSPREPTLLRRTEYCFNLRHQVKKDREREREGEMQTSLNVVLPSPNFSCDIINQF